MSSQDYPFVTPDDQPAQPAVPSQAPPDPGIMQQWNDALADPTVRSSLLQFGISMLQPPSFGDSFGSQFGRAVGNVGEAASAREAEDIKRQDSDSKAAARETQAAAAETRANAAADRATLAGGNADIARQRLSLQQLMLDSKKNSDLNKRRVEIANAYTREKIAYEKRRFLDPTLPEFPPLEQYAREHGVSSMVDTSGGSSSIGTFPDAPTDPTLRKPGATYNTPRGALRWTGTGWVQ